MGKIQKLFVGCPPKMTECNLYHMYMGKEIIIFIGTKLTVVIMSNGHCKSLENYLL